MYTEDDIMQYDDLNIIEVRISTLRNNLANLGYEVNEYIPKVWNIYDNLLYTYLNNIEQGIKNIGEAYLNMGIDNLFDKDNANILNSYINSVNKTIQRGSSTKTLYISIQGVKTYTVSKILSSRFIVMTCTSTPQNGVVGNTIISSHNSTSITITNKPGDKYLVVFYYNSDYDTLTEQEILNSIYITNEKPDGWQGTKIWAPKMSFGYRDVNRWITNLNIIEQAFNKEFPNT